MTSRCFLGRDASALLTFLLRCHSTLSDSGPGDGMNDVVRLELTGRNAEAWDRVFQFLTDRVQRAVEGLAPDMDEAASTKAKEVTADLAEISKQWIRGLARLGPKTSTTCGNCGWILPPHTLG